MQKPTRTNLALLGIERVTLLEEIEVAQVDVMTRSLSHASALELTFGVTPFRFARGQAILHAFSRLPAASARKWLEEHGVTFAIRPDGLRPDGPVTWVQGGFAAEGAGGRA